MHTNTSKINMTNNILGNSLHRSHRESYYLGLCLGHIGVPEVHVKTS